MTSSTKNFDSLPDEVVVEIFSYLPVMELVTRVQDVCQRWRELVHDIRLWKDYSYAPPLNCELEKVLAMLSKMPQLRSLELCEDFNHDAILAAASRMCPEITSLVCNVPDIFRRNPDALYNFPNLMTLHVHPSVLTVMAIQDSHSSRTLPKLQNVRSSAYIEHYGDFSHNNQCNINSSFRGLTQLELMVVETYPLMERLVEENCETVHTLRLYGVYSRILELALKCEQLRELRLDFLSRVVDGLRDKLPRISNLPNLQKLSLRLFVDECRDVLCNLLGPQGNLAQLHELDLAHCMNFSCRVASGIVSSCPTLQVLRLTACVHMDDSCLEQLSKCRELRVLSISGCTGVTEVGLAHIAKAPKLETLDLSWLGGVSGLMLNSLTRSSSLRNLCLDFDEVSEPMLIAATLKMPSLCRLSVYKCPEVRPAVVREALRHVRVLARKPSLTLW